MTRHASAQFKQLVGPAANELRGTVGVESTRVRTYADTVSEKCFGFRFLAHTPSSFVSIFLTVRCRQLPTRTAVRQLHLPDQIRIIHVFLENFETKLDGV